MCKNAEKTTCPKGHALQGANLVAARLAKGWRECRLCAIARTRQGDARKRAGRVPTFDTLISEVMRDHPEIALAALLTSAVVRN